MFTNAIYINLPIQNVARSRAFWSALGFTFNEQFSDEHAVCMVLKPDTIFVMLIEHEMFNTFTHRPIADGSTTQVLLAIDVESREKVDETIRTAIANGATHYLAPEDQGWMYYDRFADPDGHQWEVMYADMSLLPPDFNQ